MFSIVGMSSGSASSAGHLRPSRDICALLRRCAPPSRRQSVMHAAIDPQRASAGMLASMLDQPMRRPGISIATSGEARGLQRLLASHRRMRAMRVSARRRALGATGAPGACAADGQLA